MKKLVGTFRTEEEAILAINDLKDMGLDAHEITVVTHDQYDYNSIKGYDQAITPGSLQVGSVYHGEGVHNFVNSLAHYGIPEEKARMYNEGFQEGRFLVFIGVDEHIRHHMDNPGTYRAPDLFIDDIETPGTYTIVTPHHDEPDTPGMYVAEEYGNGPTNPGTYEDPVIDDEIITPGTYTEDEVIDPPHHMVKNPDEHEPDPVFHDRDVEDDLNRDLDDARVRTERQDPFDPDRTPRGAANDEEVIYTTKDNTPITEDDFDPVYNERDLKDRVDPEKINRNASVDEKDPFDPDRPLF